MERWIASVAPVAAKACKVSLRGIAEARPPMRVSTTDCATSGKVSSRPSAAAAAALGRELTLPEVAQSVVLTRIGGRASAMPRSETLQAFAATGATLAIHLSIHALGDVVEAVLPFYGASCPAAVVARASWPDEQILRAPLGGLVAAMRESPVERTALILVGPALGADHFRGSALYDADYVRRFRGGPANS